MNELIRTAEAYEELLVPSLFEPWARRLADAADVQDGDFVLDVACGTGVLTRAILERVGSGGSVSGVDLNPAMISVARRTSPRIDWQEGDAESLPFDDETFDVVVSQFGLMFFASPTSALQEIWRVLKSGGTLALAVFDGLEKNAAYATMADAFERVIGSSVGSALRFPFSMGDATKLTDLLLDARIEHPSIATHTETARFASPRQMVLSDVEGWFPFADIHLDDSTIEAVVDEAERALAPFRAGDGGVEFPVAAHVISARKS